MTREELTRMTGSEEQAMFALDILLNQIKPEFVTMVIQAELKDIEEQLTKAINEEIIVKVNNTYSVNWKKEYTPLNGATVWNATKEQLNEMNAIREKLDKADALLYRRNRVISLTSVR